VVFYGKPLFFYAPSMGPFTNKFLNTIRKFILKKSKLIVVREDISAKYLKEQLGLDSYVTIDSAFQNQIPENYISKYPDAIEIINMVENRKVVGLTITDLKWHPKYKAYSKLKDNILQSMLEFVEFLVNKGYTVLLIPQLFGEQNDTVLLQQFQKLDKSKIMILPEDIDSYAQQLIISKLFCFIGMRYRSNIFAAKQRIPFISIYYEHKMKGFMDKLGLTELTINVEDISSKEVINKFNYIEENHEVILTHLNNNIPILIEESQKTTSFVLNSLKSLDISKK
jgi:colanic acid/amylovoran biosynthesis protein